MAPLVQLGDLVRIEKGKKASQVFERPSATARRYLQIDDLRPDAKRKFVEPFACPVASKTDVVIAWDGANAGTVSCNLDGYIGSTLAVLRPSTQQLFAPYLSRFLEGKFDYLQKNSTGATVPHVSRDVLENLELPLPSLNEQQRIAALLEQADSLRRTRRYALELSDSFLPAAFLELFGDPVCNTMGWPPEAIYELGKVTTGGTPPSGKPGMFGGSIPFLTPGDLEVNTAHSNRFLTEAGATANGTVRAGSTMVCCIGATIGKTDIARARSSFNQQLNAVEWSMRINDSFGFYLMRFFAQLVADRGRSTTLPILKKSAFEEIRIPVPPLPLQQKFAALVERHERLRATQREALRQAEHLFQTLLHRAFNQELKGAA